MQSAELKKIFTARNLDELFPESRTNDFFEALFGEAEEGSYTIRLRFEEAQGSSLRFLFELHQRPGKCLACNLTTGLPHVFTRHPIIDAKGTAHALCDMLPAPAACETWEIGPTRQYSSSLHAIPLTITLSGNHDN
jgi:hypothetical protein